MAKFNEAAARFLQDIFICKKCTSKVRAANLKVLQGNIKCRKCNSNKLRPKRKK